MGLIKLYVNLFNKDWGYNKDLSKTFLINLQSRDNSSHCADMKP